MRRLEIMALLVLAFVVASCGVSQKAQNQLLRQQLQQLQYQQQQQYLQNQQLQQQLQQQQLQQQYQQQQQYMQNQHQQQMNATEILHQRQLKMANENACEYLATQWTVNEIRAYGIGTGFDKEAARQAARFNAEGELNSIMHLWASDFLRRTNLAVQKNGANTQERVTQGDQIRFSEGDLKGVKTLLVEYSDTPAGVECQMCLTMDATAATNALLSQAEIQGALNNAAKFRAEADKAREEIRLMKTGTNAEMQKKQAEMNLQMQQQNQMYQQNQQSIQQQQNYNLQKDKQYYDYKLQQNQQNQQYNQQEQYNPQPTQVNQYNQYNQYNTKSQR